MKKERKSIMKHLCCQPTGKMVVYNYNFLFIGSLSNEQAYLLLLQMNNNAYWSD